MMKYHNQAMDAMVKGWTRIDMLLALYSRTISTVREAEEAKKAGDSQLFSLKLLDVNRLLLGLHSGLNVDEYPLASDVARLLNFVSLRISEENFTEAIYFLEKLHTSFSQIRDEAADLEKAGSIPPFVEANTLDTIA